MTARNLFGYSGTRILKVTVFLHVNCSKHPKFPFITNFYKNVANGNHIEIICSKLCKHVKPSCGLVFCLRWLNASVVLDALPLFIAKRKQIYCN